MARRGGGWPGSGGSGGGCSGCDPTAPRALLCFNFAKNVLSVTIRPYARVWWGDGSKSTVVDDGAHTYPNAQPRTFCIEPPTWDNITYLALEVNGLTSVPAALGELVSLEVLDLKVNSLTSVPLGIAALPVLRLVHVNSNNISQADMSAFVDALWLNRVQLGANSCNIRLEANNGLTATAAAQVDGTGSYAGDGLVQAGCTVSY